MNPDTGHLVSLLEGKKPPKDYEAIPRRLEAIAQAELAGRAEAHVDLTARSPLADWAKKKRLAKIAAKSRRRNRK